MKRILFISRSELSHNLLRAILPLVSYKVRLVCVDEFSEAMALPQKGKPFDFILVDWNSLSSLENLSEKLEILNNARLFKEVRRALICPHDVDCSESLLQENGFVAFHRKPFLTEELAAVIAQGIKVMGGKGAGE